MRQILGVVVAFAVLGAVMRLLERRFSARPSAPLWARARIVDVLHWFVGGPLGRLSADIGIVIAVILALPALIFQRIGHPQSGHEYVTPFMHLPLGVQIPVALIVVDFLGYWSHRLQHAAPLWRFHAVHHSARELDWLAAARNHPVTEVAGRVLAGVPLIVLGIDPRVLGGFFSVVGLWAVFLHANVRWRFGPLRWVISTPLFHRWHHSRSAAARDKNFAALFPIWDIVFGTFYLPDAQPEEFGVDAEEAVPEGFVGQMLHPLRSSRRARTTGVEVKERLELVGPVPVALCDQHGAHGQEHHWR